ncbi:MAG: hypothetical protein JJE04_18665 [Acidobacteriia bacterium]|nr:hypothetical protein [Terriglobia bacterium]
MRKLTSWMTATVCGLLIPMAMMALSGGPPPMRTGAAIDGGLDCTACHQTFRPANSDPRGKITIQAGAYKPGIKQTIKILLEHPEASRWGFQLTARLASDESKKAGTFTPTTAIRVRCGAGAPDGNCGTQTEFASHNASSTQVGTLLNASFEVEWTPPDTASGPVVFYAAGNAANNSLSNAGDRIYTTKAMIDAPCELTETPKVTALRNGASFVDGPVSLNTMISIGGTGFQAPGASRAVAGSDIVDGKFPAALGCIAVEIGGRRAPLTFVNYGQINAQVPSITDLGQVSVRVIANPGEANEKRSEPFMMTLQQTSPAFFRFLPTPCIAAVDAVTGQLAGDPDLLPGVKGSKVGDLISLFATGLGETLPFYQAGEISSGLSRLKDTVQIDWQGTMLRAEDILYAGLAPNSISGLYQINVRVPSTARVGVHNNLKIIAGGVLSPDGTTIYVAP